MKVTIDLDPDIYRAVKVEAARADRSVRDIVDEALAAWLERLEDAEDAAAAAEALAEYERDGGGAAEGFFRAHAAETRAAYGSPGEADDTGQVGHRGVGADDADTSGAAGALVDEG
jgi:plasmid stability protein